MGFDSGVSEPYRDEVQGGGDVGGQDVYGMPHRPSLYAQGGVSGGGDDDFIWVDEDDLNDEELRSFLMDRRNRGYPR